MNKIDADRLAYSTALKMLDSEVANRLVAGQSAPSSDTAKEFMKFVNELSSELQKSFGNDLFRNDFPAQL
ncbi:hypothetical protein VI06_03375 [Aquitalea magnusonii]|nr:hypothetical protein VI06_03375 [Aquitalea magnusonii]